MFIIRGVNVFPSQIETALLKTEASLPHYQIVLTRKSGLDRMEVRVEVTGEMLRDRLSEMEGLQRRFAHSIEQITSLHTDVIPRAARHDPAERRQGEAGSGPSQRFCVKPVTMAER